MTTFIDLTGRRFGRLSIRYETPDQDYIDIFRARWKGERLRNGQPAAGAYRAWRKRCGLFWFCRCACGRGLDVRGADLRSGNTTSCGCAKADLTRARNAVTKTKHGRASNRAGKKADRLYVTWFSMINRCYCASATNYKFYGARGVTVCDRWRTSFEAFAADMGLHPGAGWSIDRVAPEGNYEPTNCRWATAKQQANNKRKKS